MTCRRAHQSEVVRHSLEARLGAHAAELALKDTQVAYLSGVMGHAEGLLEATQRHGAGSQSLTHRWTQGTAFVVDRSGPMDESKGLLGLLTRMARRVAIFALGVLPPSASMRALPRLPKMSSLGHAIMMTAVRRYRLQ